MINHINTEHAGSPKPKPCSYCGALGHMAFGCRKKPRKPLQTNKRLSKAGKLAKAYTILRENFFRDNPEGPYYCVYCQYIGVEQPLERWEVNIEHYHSKARRPDLRFKKENLVVSCAFHNQEKGSLDGDSYIKKLDEMRRNNGRN